MKKFITIFQEVIILYLINPITTFIISFIYGLYSIEKLPDFLNNYLSYFILFINLIYLIYLLSKKSIKFNIPKKNFFPHLTIVLSASVIINSLIFLTNHHQLTTNNNLFLLIIGTSLIGPIVEELVFRSCLYNNFNKQYSSLKTVIITTIVFAFFHNGLTNIIYAMLIGLLLNLIYYQNKNILETIIIHIIINFITIFLLKFDMTIFLFAIFLFILSLGIEIINVKNNKKFKKNY